MKEKIEILKKLWGIPRYRSLIILGIYILFFASIMIYSKSISYNQSNYVEEKTPLEKMALKENYEFTMNINGNTFNGSKSNDIIVIDNKEINIDDNSFEYQEILKYLDLNYLYNKVKDKEAYSKTEYSDKSSSENYKLEQEEITIYQKDEEIYQFEIKIEDRTYLIIFN